MQPIEVEQFCQYLKLRNYSGHTIASYRLDLQWFFAPIEAALEAVGWRQIDQFIRQQHNKGLSAGTINRRLRAIKQFFDYLVIETERVVGNPVKPSHYLRQGRPLPKRLSGAQVKQLFSVIHNPMDGTMFLLMLRCGLRVSEVVQLKVADIDWQQRALLVEQGKGRKDRWLYLSSDALCSLRECTGQRPAALGHEYFFWNQKRKRQALGVKAVQKRWSGMRKPPVWRRVAIVYGIRSPRTCWRRGRRSSP
jgi:site-specific recombinase XerD